jgi:FkbM family methyltransferase
MLSKKLGYTPTLKDTIIRIVAKFFSKILSVNNYFVNEIIQNIDLKNHINFEGKKIYFKTGHNRLDWRVNSFYKEEPMMVDWIKSFNEKDIFLDIGANVGIYTLPAITKCKFTYASELDIKNNAILFENLIKNEFQNKCLMINFGMSDKNNIEEIFYRENSVGDALQSIARDQIIPTKKNSPFQIKQFCFSLDYIFESFKLEYPNKIKIDVDGNEKKVFEGGKKVILNAKEIYFEDNDLVEDKEIIKEILKVFTVKKEEPAARGIDGRKLRNILFIKN